MGIQATLRALADPTRREILNLLKHGKKSAGEITQAFSICLLYTSPSPRDS